MDEMLSIQPVVLILDNDRARSAQRCGQIASRGWHVQCAQSLKEAIDILQVGQVDLALAHVSPSLAASTHLPQQMQRARCGAFLPIIILCDQRAGEQERCACLDSGADEVLSDSISGAELWARMRALLRIKDLLDELVQSRYALEEALRREQDLLATLRQDKERAADQPADA